MAHLNRTEYFVNLRKSFQISPQKSAETSIFLDINQQNSSHDGLQLQNLIHLKAAIEVDLEKIDELMESLEKKLDEYKFGLPTLTIQSEVTRYVQAKASLDNLFLRLKGHLNHFKLDLQSKKASNVSIVLEQFREHLGAHLAYKLSVQFERFQIFQKMFNSILFERQFPAKSFPNEKDVFSVNENGEDDEAASTTQLQSHQVVLDDSTKNMLEEREEEISKVVNDVNYVNEILNQIQVMTVEQGSLLDRIDVNLDKTQGNLDQAIGRLEKTAEKYSVHQKRLILMFIALMIFVTGLAVTFKGQ